MNNKEYFEEYPCWIVIVSNLVSIVIYASGSFIMYHFGKASLLAYLLYILLAEIKVLRTGCVNCNYYGKLCAFGKGKISSLLFKKGDNKKFSQRKIKWKDILPDFLVTLIPMAAGVILLIREFNWPILASIILLALFGFIATGIVRGLLACKHCKQRQKGCPAEQLFNKKK
jgi:hypothetical protein